MTAHDKDPRAAFEEAYALVRSPTPKQGVSAQVVHDKLALLGVMEHDALDELVQFVIACAQGNDVDSMRILLDAGFADEAQRLEDEMGNASLMDLTYSVCHMLVDNGDNVAFAHEWLQAFGHTRELAAQVLVERWKDGNDGRSSAQMRLGLATIADVFAKCRPDKEMPSPFSRGLERDSSVNTGRQVRDLAFFLRTAHPDGIPDIPQDSHNSKTIPVSDKALWHDELSFKHLLPAFDLAYSANHHPARSQARQTMVAGIESMLKYGRLDINFRTGLIEQWEAITAWGLDVPDLGKRIWHAQSHAGGQFIAGLADVNFDKLSGPLEQLLAMGADLQEPIQASVGLDRHERFLELAVQFSNVELVRWLLAQGCDPDLQSERDAGVFRSAAQLAIIKEEAVRGAEPEASRAEQVASLIRAVQASKSARSVLNELELSASARISP